MKQVEQRRRTAGAYAEARRAQEHTLQEQVSPALDWWDEETGRASNLLRRMFRGRLQEKFELQYTRPLRTRLESHFAGVAARLEKLQTSGTKELLVEGSRATGGLVERLSGQRPPEGLATRVEARHVAALERLRADTARGLGQQLGERTWQGLQSAFASQVRTGDLVTLVGELMDQEAWRVERLVRTEASYGYNLGQAAALQAWPRDAGELIWGRWVERVDDLTGTPLDQKVAPDSLVMHGQVTRPGGLFTMPPDPRAPERLIGKSWAHPPNRPNDRSVYLPWSRDWGTPGWVWQAGRRIDLARLDPGRAVGILAED